MTERFFDHGDAGAGARAIVPAGATGGDFFVAEGSADTPGRSALHVHAGSDEFVHVLSGTLEMTVGEETRRVGPGQSVFLPRGVAHRFAALEPARWLVVGSGPYQVERARLSAAVAAGAEGAAVYEGIDGVEHVAD